MTERQRYTGNDRDMVLHTGLSHCFDSDGHEVPCPGSGQDGEYAAGRRVPEPRFADAGRGLVLDRLTGLLWPADVSLVAEPLSWREALTAVDRLNRDRVCGRHDWRLPNRRELRSLISHGARKPALPAGHPFVNFFVGWYWTSTTSAPAPAYAWYIHLEGGRMFYGRKDSFSFVWPVAGSSTLLPQTGQTDCFDETGAPIPCGSDGQDGALRRGLPWPQPRFIRQRHGIVDTMSGRIWHADAAITAGGVSWDEALAAVRALARRSRLPWRLPTINELESLVDASRHSPALPAEHPFASVRRDYWSSTTSFFEPDWAYVLYLAKGAVGVGFKKNRDCAVWPVMSPGGAFTSYAAEW